MRMPSCFHIVLHFRSSFCFLEQYGLLSASTQHRSNRQPPKLVLRSCDASEIWHLNFDPKPSDPRAASILKKKLPDCASCTRIN